VIGIFKSKGYRKKIWECDNKFPNTLVLCYKGNVRPHDLGHFVRMGCGPLTMYWAGRVRRLISVGSSKGFLHLFKFHFPPNQALSKNINLGLEIIYTKYNLN